MNLVDIIVIIIALLAVARGLKFGLAMQAFSLLGFFAGLLLGSVLAKHISSLGHDPLTRAVISLVVTLGPALILSLVGEVIGWRVREAAHKLHMEPLDTTLGALFEMVAWFVIVWLIAAPLSNLQIDNIATLVHHSVIVQALDRLLPPAPNLVARLEHVIEPNGFPKVFLGPEPSQAPVVPPSLDTLKFAIDADSTSTVKIEGDGCGGTVEGSGFVVASNLVATNAHVVAGISRPVVLDNNGRHIATPVYFDPDLDFAVIRVNGLAGDPLKLNPNEVPPNTPGAVLGYPEGGPLSVAPASVLDTTTAVGRNIYDEGITNRTIYEISADVEPGNSGGPLIQTDGSVMGVVFAKSQDNAGIGYTLTSAEIIESVRQATTANAPADTGACSTG